MRYVRVVHGLCNVCLWVDVRVPYGLMLRLFMGYVRVDVRIVYV